MAPLRTAAGLPPVAVPPPPASFAGRWELDEDASTPDGRGGSALPAWLEVSHEGDHLTIRATTPLEYEPDRVTEWAFELDEHGTGTARTGRGRVATVRLAPGAATLQLETSWTRPPELDGSNDGDAGNVVAQSRRPTPDGRTGRHDRAG